MVVFDELRITPDGKNLIISIHVNTDDVYKDLTIEGVYINTDLDFLESGVNMDALVYSKRFTEQIAGKLSLYSSEKVLVGHIENPVFYANKECTRYYENLTVDEFEYKRCNIVYVGDEVIGFVDSNYPNNPFYIQTTLNLESINAVDSFVIPVKSSGQGKKKLDLVVNCNELLGVNDFTQNLFFVYVKENGVPSICTPCGFDGEYTLGVTFDSALLYQRAMDYIKEIGSTCEIPKNMINFILLFQALKSSIESEHYIPAVNFFNKLFKSSTRPSVNCGCYGKNSV